MTPQDVGFLRQRRDEARAWIEYVESLDTKAGVVRDEATSDPISGAMVTLQASGIKRSKDLYSEFNKAKTTGHNAELDWVTTTASNANLASEEIRKIAASRNPSVEYPDTSAPSRK